MSAQDNLAVARGWAQAAFGQHDLEAAEFLAPDRVGHWVGMLEGHGETPRSSDRGVLAHRSVLEVALTEARTTSGRPSGSPH